MSTTWLPLFVFVIASILYCSASPVSRSSHQQDIAESSQTDTNSMLTTLSELIKVLQPHHVKERKFLRQIEREFLHEMNNGRRHHKRASKRLLSSYAGSEILMEVLDSRLDQILSKFAEWAQTNPKKNCQLKAFIEGQTDVSHCENLATN